MASLNEIISEIEKSSYPKIKKEEEEQFIIIESKTGEILEEPPLFAKARYFKINRKKVVFDIKAPLISLKYLNSEKPFVVYLSYSAQISKDGTYRLVRFLNRSISSIASVDSYFTENISSYIFKHDNFIPEFNDHKSVLEGICKELGVKIGLDIKPTISSNATLPGSIPFISIENKVIAKTKDGQTVEIKHDLALTLVDSVKYSISGIEDLKAWAKLKLEQFTNNALIEMSYAEVLVGMEDSIIKRAMEAVCSSIGFQLKQLITVPGVDIEKFYFETSEGEAGNTEYGTKDPRFKIAIKVIINGKLNLNSAKTKEHIKPSLDIIAKMKANVIEFSRIYFNDKTPEDCFLKMYELEDLFIKYIRNELNKEYAFKDLTIKVQFLETNLSKRFSLLQERPYEIKITGDWKERVFSFKFRIQNVAEEGWYRFRANNYLSTEEELKDIGAMVHNFLSSALRFNKENTKVVVEEEFKKAQLRVRSEFGLIIGPHDFYEEEGEGMSRIFELDGFKNHELKEQQKLIKLSETEQLQALLEKKKQAILDGESKKVISDINDEINSFKSIDLFSQSSLKEKTLGNPFLSLTDKNQLSSNSDINSKSDE